MDLSLMGGEATEEGERQTWEDWEVIVMGSMT